jgi:tetratricopeptide (TPR) repeat protein
MAEPRRSTAPSLGRDALSGRLERALAELEDQDSPASAWQRAWLLTAVGRYGEALAACARAREGDAVLQASASMTEAMLYRQVSLHGRAEEADADALAVLQRGRVRSAAVRAAIRIGQVADAVGSGADPDVLSRRLQVASAAVTAAGSWRQGVRLTWVRGEVMMVRGAHREAARTFAAGAKVAAEQGARRHHAKSLIFLAASQAASGNHDEADTLARRGLQLAARCGASPLVWPAELILAEVCPDEAAGHLDRARQFAGGVIATLPDELRAEAMQRPPASWLLASVDAAGDGGTPGAASAASPVVPATDA